MATHSIILAQRILWTEKPGGLQSTGLQRVGHDRSYLAQEGCHSCLEFMQSLLFNHSFTAFIREEGMIIPINFHRKGSFHAH